MLYEIRWHGRGGQGVVTAALLLAEAAVEEGMYALAIPFFGAERRGAPVVAYNKLSDSVIWSRGPVRKPHAVAVLDSSLLSIVNVTEGLREGGVLVVNTRRRPSVTGGQFSIAYVDATGIAVEEGLVLAGYPLVNMAMVGAVARVIGLIRLESLRKAVFRRWSGSLAEKNWKCVKRGYEEVVS